MFDSATNCMVGQITFRRFSAIAVSGLIALMIGSSSSAAQATDSASGSSSVLTRINGDSGDVETSGALITIKGTADNIRAAGASVDIDATVSGTVEAAGAAVTINGDITGGVRASGAMVDVQGKVAGSAEAAGAVVRFDTEAGGDVSLVGASIEVGAGSRVDGDFWAAGASVTVAGTITGATEIYAAAVVFGATAANSVSISAENVFIDADANITGDLIVQSDTEPVIADGATISGQVRLEEPRSFWVLPSWLWGVIMAVVLAAGAVLAAMILLLLGRGTFEESLDKAAFHPISSGLIGLASLVVIPVLAALLLASVIGISFGIALIAVLPFLFVAGHATVAACIGVWIFDRSGGPRSVGQLIVYAIAGAVIVAIVWLIPWIGGIVAGIATLIGLGAYLRTLTARMRRRNIVPA